MTRDVGANVVAAVESGVYAPVFLIEASFEDSDGSDETLYLWTGLGTLSYGGNSYAGTGSLLTIDGLQEVLDVASRGLTVVLDGIGISDVNSAGDTILDLAYRTEYQNRPFSLSLALIDTDTRDVIDTPIPWFSGFMDVMDPSEDGQTATISLTVENALVALQRKVERTYTKEDQQARYSDDTFFDQMTELQNMEIILE